jgi:hypothetical protein
MIAGLSVASMAGAAGTTVVGYYFRKHFLRRLFDSSLTGNTSFHIFNQHSGTNCVRSPHNPDSQLQCCEACRFIRLCWSCRRPEYTESTGSHADGLGTKGCIYRFCYHLVWSMDGFCALNLRICHIVPNPPG